MGKRYLMASGLLMAGTCAAWLLLSGLLGAARPPSAAPRAVALHGGRPALEPYANLERANLQGAELRASSLSGARLREATLAEIDLTGSDLLEADFTDADLRRATLDAVDIRRANFTGADLSGAVLNRSLTPGAVFKNSNLRGASLVGADFTGIVLTGADLSGADMTKCFNYKAARSVEGANIHGVLNAPQGFREWALSRGAVERPGNPAAPQG